MSSKHLSLCSAMASLTRKKTQKSMPRYCLNSCTMYLGAAACVSSVAYGPLVINCCMEGNLFDLYRLNDTYKLIACIVVNLDYLNFHRLDSISASHCSYTGKR